MLDKSKLTRASGDEERLRTIRAEELLRMAPVPGFLQWTGQCEPGSSSLAAATGHRGGEKLARPRATSLMDFLCLAGDIEPRGSSGESGAGLALLAMPYTRSEATLLMAFLLLSGEIEPMGSWLETGP